MSSNRLSVRRIALYLFLFFTAALSIWLMVNLISGSSTRIKIDESTTYITDPSQRDPSKVDYVAYANRKLSLGVTPQNNAVATLIKFSPQLGPDSFDSKYLKLLDVSAIGLKKFKTVPADKILEKIIDETEAKLIKAGNWTEENREATRNRLEALMYCPWDVQKFPSLANWLESHEAILNEVREAAAQSHYYSPLVCDETSGLISALLPVCQQTREFSRGLALRAMHFLHEGNVEQCQADLLAIRKLAAHLSKGPFYVQKIISFSNLGVARKAEWAMARNENVSAEQLEKYLSQIRGLTVPEDCLTETLLYERMMILDAVSKVAHFGAEGLSQVMAMGGRSKDNSTGRFFTNVAISMIDWNVVLQEINIYFDNVQDVMKEPDLATQTVLAKRIEEELTERAEESHDAGNIAWAMLAGRKAKGKLAANYAVAMFMPAISTICNSRNDAIVQEKIIRCQIGIEIYRKQQGKLPNRLEDVSALQPQDWVDLHTGKAFASPTELFPALYSLGPNQKDDQGRTRYSEPAGDDIPLHFE